MDLAGPSLYSVHSGWMTGEVSPPPPLWKPLSSLRASHVLWGKVLSGAGWRHSANQEVKYQLKCFSFLKKININGGSNIFFPHHNWMCIYINFNIYETKVDKKCFSYVNLMLILWFGFAFVYFFFVHPAGFEDRAWVIFLSVFYNSGCFMHSRWALIIHGHMFHSKMDSRII